MWEVVVSRAKTRVSNLLSPAAPSITLARCVCAVYFNCEPALAARPGLLGRTRRPQTTAHLEAFKCPINTSGETHGAAAHRVTRLPSAASPQPLYPPPTTEPNTNSFSPKMASVKTITFLNLICLCCFFIRISMKEPFMLRRMRGEITVVIKCLGCQEHHRAQRLIWNPS